MSQPSLVETHQAQILAILNATQDDMSLKQIVRHMNVGIPRMWDLLRPMVDAQMIHVTRLHGSARFYRPGPGTGAMGPSVEARILQTLAETPMTARQLSEHLGISKSHVCHIINGSLRAEGKPKQVYIRQYVRQGKQRPILYAVGNRPDSQKPKPITQAEKSRRARVRLRADQDRHEAAMKKDRARKIQPRQDAFMAQFAGVFGERRVA